MQHEMQHEILSIFLLTKGFLSDKNIPAQQKTASRYSPLAVLVIIYNIRSVVVLAFCFPVDYSSRFLELF